MSLFQFLGVTTLFPILLFGNMETNSVAVRGNTMELDNPRMNSTTETRKTEKALCTFTVNSDERNGIIGKRYRWKYFDVYADPVFSNKHRRLIQASMDRLKKVLPCVTFKLWPKWFKPLWGDYVYIVNNTGCTSKAGRIGGGQKLSLQIPMCMTKGNVLHEMLHALGLAHEHTRPDRDEYIIIHEENIRPGYEHNYEKLDPRNWSTYGVPYNERSILHYPAVGFSINGEPIITSKRNITLGGSEDLQETDVLKLQRMYNCSR